MILNWDDNSEWSWLFAFTAKNQKLKCVSKVGVADTYFEYFLSDFRESTYLANNLFVWTEKQILFFLVKLWALWIDLFNFSY